MRDVLAVAAPCPTGLVCTEPSREPRERSGTKCRADDQAPCVWAS